MTLEDQENTKPTPEIEKQIRKKTLPVILYTLLKEKKLDRSRLDDKVYVWSVIYENLDEIVTEDMPVVVYLDTRFLDSAKNAFSEDKPEVAVVLAVTAIEHKLNSFYRDILELKLSEDMTTEAISSNTNAKLGWLMQLASGYSISEELRKKLVRLIELRNAVVHRKFKTRRLSDPNSLLYPIPGTENLDIKELVSAVDELDNELQQIQIKVDPDIKLVQDITENLLSVPPTSELINQLLEKVRVIKEKLSQSKPNIERIDELAGIVTRLGERLEQVQVSIDPDQELVNILASEDCSSLQTITTALEQNGELDV